MTRHLHDKSTSIDIAELFADQARTETIEPPRTSLSSRAAVTKVITQTIDAAHSAYWAACDAEGRAIDPAALGAPDSLLDDAHEAALLVQSIAAERGISWTEARLFV